MNPKQYSYAKAAAAALVRAKGQLPGSVHGMDYQKASMPPSAAGSHEDIGLEALDIKRDLEDAFEAVSLKVPDREFLAWWMVRVFGYAARETGYPERTAYRVLKRVDSAVEEALIERDLIRGQDGRDLLEAGGRCARAVVVWVNEEAFRE